MPSVNTEKSAEEAEYFSTETRSPVLRQKEVVVQYGKHVPSAKTEKNNRKHAAQDWRKFGARNIFWRKYFPKWLSADKGFRSTIK